MVESSQKRQIKVSMSNELVHRRAEMLANLFLQELKPLTLMQVTMHNTFGDFYAGFRTKTGRLVTIMVEVKATEKPVSGTFRFHGPESSNIPVLILVVDVKSNELFFNWATNAKVLSSSPRSSRTTSTLSLPVRKVTEDSKRELLAEIEAK